MNRLPLAPLLALTAPAPLAGQDGPTAVLALRVGVTKRTVDRWRLSGLTPDQADRVAILAGWHPAEVWPDW